MVGDTTPSLSHSRNSASRSSLTTLTDGHGRLAYEKSGGKGSHADAPHSSSFGSSRSLSITSVTLHGALVIVHLFLIFIWWRKWEHHFTFPVDAQSIVSLFITVITTLFGSSFRRDQSLTAVHDNVAAWSGMGSAVLSFWHQKTFAASVLGVLYAFAYLVIVLVLHTTTPALFSVQTFNASHQAPVPTQGAPAFDFSGYDLSNDTDVFIMLRNMEAYAMGSFHYMPFVAGIQSTLGVRGASLYDVLESGSGIGNISVGATAFNVTCGYIPVSDVAMTQDTSFGYNLNITGIDGNFSLKSTSAAVISALAPLELLPDVVVFYSTIPILDSTGSTGAYLDLNKNFPLAFNVTRIQLFRCSLTLVNQTAVVDAQSRQLLSADPGTQTDTSRWLPFDSAQNVNFPPADAQEWAYDPYLLLKMWQLLYLLMPPSTFSLAIAGSDYISVADADILLQLGLIAPSVSTKPSDVTLHAFENALANVLASMFWTLGHIQPPPAYAGGDESLDAGNPSPTNPTQLLTGVAQVPIQFVQGQLNLSIVAVSWGFAASVLLALLSWFSCDFRTERRPEHSVHGGSDVNIDGTGILHTIWLYRNHPELEEILEQVEHPTSLNLRRAGMVQTRLLNGGSADGARRRSRKSWEYRSH